MNDQSLIDVANAFLALSDYRFNITVRRGQKELDFSVSASVGDATHICGLDHIPYIKSLCGNKIKSKSSILKKIADGTLKYSSFPISDQNDFTCDIPKTFNPLTKKPYTLENRIETLKNLMTFLDNAYKGNFYDWKDSFQGIATPDKKTRYLGIKADYMLEIPTGNFNEKLYIFLYCDQNNPNHLKIYSAFADGVNLSEHQERPYEIISEERVNTKMKQTTHLYTRPGFGNPDVMKMTFNTPSVGQNSLNSNGAAILTAPRFTFGQALTNLINKWAEKIGEGIERRRRELKSAKEEIVELKQALSERDEQLAQKEEQLNAKDNEIVGLKKQNAALMVDLTEKNRLIRAANPIKTLSQKMNDATKRSRDKNAAASPRPKSTDHHPTR